VFPGGPWQGSRCNRRLDGPLYANAPTHTDHLLRPK
jgi:hypothetical protein